MNIKLNLLIDLQSLQQWPMQEIIQRQLPLYK